MTWSKEHLPSRHTTEGVQNSFHRVFYYAMGLTTEEIHQPHIGVVAAWDDTVPVHDDVRAVTERIKADLWAYDVTPREFTTISGLDGTDSASDRAVLVSRELIADSVELTVRGHCYDALVGVAASSVALAGLALAACRLDVPAVIVPRLDATDDPDGAADALATVAALDALGLTSGDETTTASGAAGTRAVAARAAAVLADRLRDATRPRARIDAASLERAARAAGGRAGSVEPLLHLAAIAGEVGLVGDVGMLATAASSASGPRRIVCVHGGLAPGGAVAVAPAGVATVRGRAVVAASEAAACDLVASSRWRPGDVLVLRGQGPRGAPGVATCRRLARLLTDRIDDGSPPVLVTDGLAPWADGVVVVSAVSPEAAVGGPLAAVRDGDDVVLELETAKIDVAPARSEAATDAGEPGRGGPPALWKYARLVGSAMEGARTHPGARAEQHCYADL